MCRNDDYVMNDCTEVCIPVYRGNSLGGGIWEWRAGVGVVWVWSGELRGTQARQERVCPPRSPCGGVWSRPAGPGVASGLGGE